MRFLRTSAVIAVIAGRASGRTRQREGAGDESAAGRIGLDRERTPDHSGAMRHDASSEPPPALPMLRQTHAVVLDSELHAVAHTAEAHDDLARLAVAQRVLHRLLGYAVQ